MPVRVPDAQPIFQMVGDAYAYPLWVRPKGMGTLVPGEEGEAGQDGLTPSPSGLAADLADLYRIAIPVTSAGRPAG